MVDIQIDPKTGAPIIVGGIQSSAPSELNKPTPIVTEPKVTPFTPVPKVTPLVASVKPVVESSIPLIPVDKNIYISNDSPAKREGILNALKMYSGGDSMQQLRTYNTILAVLGWT